MTALAKVEAQPSLEELAETINREHLLVQQSGAAMVEHAISAGGALLLVQSQLNWGEWLPWLEANFPFSDHMAAVYMRMSTYAHVLRASDVPSINAARRLLRGNRRTVRRDDLEQETKRLFDAGVPRSDIVELLDVSKSSVNRWTTPGAVERERDYARDYARRRRDERRALREQERARAINRAVKKAGVAHQEAYSMAERMQDVLAQAQREAESRETKEALSLAWSHWAKMRDEIVRALGVS